MPSAKARATYRKRNWRKSQAVIFLDFADRRIEGLDMPELRQNYFTKEWVIIATERAKRPEELATRRASKAPAHYVDTCPFCPGNENKTPPELMRIPSPTNETWQVRVVANKFAALSPDIKPPRVIHRSRRSMGGFGIHDVIVESPNHADVPCRMAESHLADVLRAYKARYDALSLDRRIAHITIFKNHGKAAGASLEHPHSQLIAAPVISQQIRERFQQALSH
jgi:UDPglucose--hexose-1-phosphate uridylyltransferase